MGTDTDWEKWGRDDPYFGVLSDEHYRAGNMSGGLRARFFDSGEKHIGDLLDLIRARFVQDFYPERVLDFGCGVGRLLIPLARRCNHATGVDVARSMLEEADRNCTLMRIGNVDLVQSDDSLSQVLGEYDLIHSHIVFAHINPRRGHRIIANLAKKVRPDGFIAVQVLYGCRAPWVTRFLTRLRYWLPPLNALRNIVRGRPLTEPAMQLHVYKLPRMLGDLSRLGFGEALLVTDRFAKDTFDSVVVIAQRTFRT